MIKLLAIALLLFFGSLVASFSCEAVRTHGGERIVNIAAAILTAAIFGPGIWMALRARDGDA